MELQNGIHGICVSVYNHTGYLLLTSTSYKDTPIDPYQMIPTAGQSLLVPRTSWCERMHGSLHSFHVCYHPATTRVVHTCFHPSKSCIQQGILSPEPINPFEVNPLGRTGNMFYLVDISALYPNNLL